MKISEIFNRNAPTLSFEVFPPKTTASFDSVKSATEKIAALQPSFMSVTYGAGGGTSEFTVSIAKNILASSGVTPLAHLTCVSSSLDDINHQLDLMEQSGIENIMALRGDIPEGSEDRSKWSFQYASELISHIKSRGSFCVGGACYPECHPESANQRADIEGLRRKAEAGCDFITTQMFFDNNILYNFLFKLREAGITIPVVAGVMPVTNAKQIKRILQMSGTYLPQRFKQLVDHFGENPAAMKQAGIVYATDQIIDLFANGVDHVHVYSMNHPDVAARIMDNLSEII